MKTCIIYMGKFVSTLLLLHTKFVATWTEAMLQREARASPRGPSCLVSEQELFPVGSPISRERFYTEIDVIRLHFRSASGSCVEEDGSRATTPSPPRIPKSKDAQVSNKMVQSFQSKIGQKPYIDISPRRRTDGPTGT